MRTFWDVEDYFPTQVFETIRIHQGHPFRLDDHLDRLEESARTAGIRIREKRAARVRRIRRALHAARRSEGLLRLSLSRRTMRIWISPLRRPDPEVIQSGARVRTVAVCRPAGDSQPPALKSSNFLTGVLGRLDVPEVFEPIYLNRWNQVCEGSVSNLFAVTEAGLCTPPRSSGILPGVTRHWILELARRMGVRTLETVLTRHDLYIAQELFLTNSAMDVVAVRELDGRAIGGMCPGPLTKKLQQAYERLMKSECVNE